MRETDISNIAIDAAKVGGVNARSIARYERITSGINMNEHCDNPRFCGLGSWEVAKASEGAPVGEAGVLLQTPLSGGYDYELYLSVTNRIFFRPLDISSPTKKSEWKELASLASLADYVAKDELESLVKEIVSKNNEDMQVTENQSNTGGGITRFTVGSLLVSVRKKGGRHERDRHQCHQPAVYAHKRRMYRCEPSRETRLLSDNATYHKSSRGSYRLSWSPVSVDINNFQQLLLYPDLYPESYGSTKDVYETTFKCKFRREQFTLAGISICGTGLQLRGQDGAIRTGRTGRVRRVAEGKEVVAV